MGTWWNPKTSRLDVLMNSWIIITVVLWILLMIIRPENLLGSPEKFGVLGAIIGYGLNAMIGAVWLSTLFLCGWLISCLGYNHHLGFVEWWLITGIVLGIVLPILTHQTEYFWQWFLAGTCLVWYGPIALVVWLVSFLIG